MFRLARYVQVQRSMVMDLPEDDFLDGRIPWGEPPDWVGVRTDEGEEFEDGETEEEGLKRQKEEVEKR